MEELIDVIVPIGVCVVLPITIVWIIMQRKNNDTNRRTEIILAALEKNPDIGNMEEILKKMTPPQPTFREKMLRKLHGEMMWGSILTILGVALLIGMGAMAISGDYATGDISALGVIGAACFASGLGMLIAYFSGKKMLNKEGEATE